LPLEAIGKTGSRYWEHLTFAAKLEIGVRSQEPGEKRKKEEGRSQKKCFYKYEMLPRYLGTVD
jgi:hypothetical protein